MKSDTADLQLMSCSQWTCCPLTQVLNFVFTHGKKPSVISFCASVTQQNEKHSSHKEAGSSCRSVGTEICRSAFSVDPLLDVLEFFPTKKKHCWKWNPPVLKTSEAQWQRLLFFRSLSLPHLWLVGDLSDESSQTCGAAQPALSIWHVWMVFLFLPA